MYDSWFIRTKRILCNYKNRKLSICMYTEDKRTVRYSIVCFIVLHLKTFKLYNVHRTLSHLHAYNQTAYNDAFCSM